MNAQAMKTSSQMYEGDALPTQRYIRAVLTSVVSGTRRQHNFLCVNCVPSTTLTWFLFCNDTLLRELGCRQQISKRGEDDAVTYAKVP
jgi:hypothetical protein